MASVSIDRVRGVNAGKAIKVPCLCATTANITLSGEQTIDGIACVENDRVLVKDQTDTVENGIYDVSTGSWTRSPDWAGVFDVTEGTVVNVNQGTINAASTWKQATAGDSITPGVTAVTFSVVSTSDLSPLEADIAQNIADITSSENDIAALDNRITTAEGDIVTNTADIATNTADIVARDTTITDHEARISSLETETPPPDPNPTDPPTWNATLDSNKLVANIVVFNYTDEPTAAWIIVIDSATPPVNPPTGFTSGDPSGTKSVASYLSPENWYFYQYDAVNGMVLAKSPTGEDFVTVTPNDTIGPTGLVISNPSGNSVTIGSATDAGIGIDTDAYSITVDSTVYLNAINAGSYTIDRPPGEYTVYYTAKDLNGNPTDSASLTVTITAEADVGSIGFTSSLHSFSEEDVTYDVNLTGTGTDSISFDVSIIEDTGVDTTTDAVNGQFTRIAGTTVNLTGADRDEDVTITLNDANLIDVNQAFMVIDYGSQTAGVLITEESTRLLIEGSGVTEDAGWQMDSSGDYALTVEAEDFVDARNSIASGQESDAWVISSDYGSRWLESLGASTWGSNNDYGTSSTLDIEAPSIDYPLAIDSTAVSSNSATDLFDLWVRVVRSTGATYCHGSIVRDITSIVESGGTVTVTLAKNHGMSGGETVYFEDVEGSNASWYNDTSGHTVAAATPGNATFTITAGSPPSGNPDAATGNLLGADEDLIGMLSPAFVTLAKNVEWEGGNQASNQIAFYCDEAGTETLRFYCRDNDWRFDRFSIAPRVSGWTVTDVNVTDAGVKQNSQDDDMGLIVSTYSAGSGGTPGVDPDNLGVLYKPLPTDTVNPVSVFPADGNTGVGLTVKPYLDFSGMSDLHINRFNVLAPNGQRLPNTTYNVIGNRATINPGQLDEDKVYSIEFNGRVRDTDGDLKSVVFSSPPHTFRTEVQGAGSDAIWETEFNEVSTVGIGTEHKITIPEAIDIFNSPYLSSHPNANYFNNSHIVLRNAFDISNSLRGNCLEVKAYKDVGGPTGYVSFNNNDWGQTELWIAFDFGLEQGFICPPSLHVLKFHNTEFVGNTTGSNQMACFFQLWGRNPTVASSVTQGKVDFHPAIYFYNENLTQRNFFGRLDSPNYNSIAGEPCCNAPIPGATYPQLVPGRWHRFIMHMKINTVGTTDATANGIVELFMDGNPIVQKTNMPWADPAESQVIDKVSMENHYGGGASNPLYWPTQDQSIFYDRIKVSDTEITA